MEHKQENGRMRLKLAACAIVCGILLGQAGALLQHTVGSPLFLVTTAVEDEPLYDRKAVIVSNASELQQALNNAVYGTTIVITQDIMLTAPLSLQKQNVAIKLQAKQGTVTIRAAGGRHMGCGGSNIDLLFEGVILDGNGTGGGISSTVSGLSLSGAVIQNCYSSGSGGAVEVASGSLLIEEGTELKANRAAAYGGGISLGAGASLQLDGGAIQGNQAGAYGGGIFSGVSGRVHMDGGVIADNSAILGAGIYCGLQNEMHITGGEITGNTALGAAADAGRGGGIYIVTGDIELAGGLISGNQAYSGGGIYATGDGSDIVILKGKVTGNRAVGANSFGGGIFLDTAYSAPNTLTLNGGHIDGNEAVRGGGIFAGGSKPSEATTNYGASVPALVTLNTGFVQDNHAALGGGLFADQGVSAYFGGGEMRRNSAKDGGAIWITPLKNLLVEQEAVFAENLAETAVYTPAQEHVVLHRNQVKTKHFSGNFAYGYNNYDIIYEGGTAVPQTRTVTFDYNGADDGEPREYQRTVNYGQPVGTLPNPAKTGGRFSGWYTAENGGSRVTADAVITEDITIYARFEAEQYTLYFDYNGAEPPADDFLKKDVVFGQPLGYLPIPVRGSDEAFVGWFDQSGKHYFPATIFKTPENKTLTAEWAPVDLTYYTVTFEYDGAVAGNEEASRIVLESQELGLLPEPQKPGFSFGGWYDINGNGPYDAAVPVFWDMELIAQWDAVSWRVTFDYMGADDTGLPRQKEVAHNQQIGELPLPNWDGYQFLGWYSDTEWSEQYSTDSQVTGDLLLYACWEPERYHIYFDYQGAIDTGGMPESKPVAYGGKIGALPIPAKTGHYFSGWFTQPEGAGRYLGGGTSGKQFAQQQDLQLYASWEQNQYLVTFDYHGATGGDTLKEKIVEYGNNIGYLPFPQRDGYRFAGWYENPQGEGMQYFVSTIYLNQEASTLHAHWIAEEEENLINTTRNPKGRPISPQWSGEFAGGQTQQPDNPATGLIVEE